MATAAREKRAGEIILINPNDIVFEEGFNARQKYEGIEELALSILNDGQVNPLKVYKGRKGTEYEGKYIARVGHRRTLAGQHIVNNMGQADFMLKAEKLSKDDPIANLLLQFNSQSEFPLNDMEKADLINRLRQAEENGERVITDEEIQNRIGISTAQMYNLLALVDTPKTVQASIVKGEISATTVNAIIRENAEGRGKNRKVDMKAVAKEVKSLVKSAKTSKTSKGKKGSTVTGANRKERKQSLQSKINELKLQAENGAVSSTVIQNFIQVVNALEEGSVQEVLTQFPEGAEA